jgi:hypothetical protein
MQGILRRTSEDTVFWHSCSWLLHSGEYQENIIEERLETSRLLLKKLPLAIRGNQPKPMQLLYVKKEPENLARRSF